MKNYNTEEADNKIDNKEELEELLRILSRPTAIKSKEEYEQLTARAKKLIADGYFNENAIEEFLNQKVPFNTKLERTNE